MSATSRYTQTIPDGLAQLQANNQYVRDLVTYFDGNINKVEPKDVTALLQKTKQYVEDTCAQIATNILDIGTDLTCFLALQCNELDTLSHRIDAINTRVTAHEQNIAARYTSEISQTRYTRPRGLKLQRKPVESLPEHLRPNTRPTHEEIDLDALTNYSGAASAPTTAPRLSPQPSVSLTYERGSIIAPAAAPIPATPSPQFEQDMPPTLSSLQSGPPTLSALQQRKGTYATNTFSSPASVGYTPARAPTFSFSPAAPPTAPMQFSPAPAAPPTPQFFSSPAPAAPAAPPAPYEAPAAPDFNDAYAAPESSMFDAAPPAPAFAPAPPAPALEAGFAPPPSFIPAPPAPSFDSAPARPAPSFGNAPPPPADW